MLKKGGFAASFLVTALASRSLLESPPPPEPSTEAMEPQVREAIAAAGKAVAEDIGSGEAWGKLGMIFHAHYLDAEAARCYREALALDSRDFRWPYLLARTLKGRDPERALLAIEEAGRRRSDYVPLFLLEGEILEARADAEGALATYQRALAIDADSAPAELGIGRLLLAQGVLNESAKHLERARDLAPDGGSIHAALSQLYRRLGREGDAVEAVRQAQRLHPDLDVDDPVLTSVMEQAVSVAGYQSRAVEAERAGDPARAEALHRRAIEIRPADASLRFNLANHLSRQGRDRDAASSYREALELDPGHVATLVNLGILVAAEGKLDEAEALFQQALEREPGHAGALLGLGNVYASEGRLERAIRLFERALESDPSRPDGHYALGRALALNQKPERAIERFLRALEGAPERAEIHLHLAALYADRGDRESAERHIQLARSKGQEPPAALVRLLDAVSKPPE
jgi:tetratricopeptide (TPR) repeat protein